MTQVASPIQPSQVQGPPVPAKAAVVPVALRIAGSAAAAPSAWASWRPALGAQLVSLLLHGALVFNAAMFEFHRPLVTRDADLKVARGEVPVEVTLVLDPEVKLVDQTEPLPPAPEPPTPPAVTEVPPEAPIPPTPPVPPTPPAPPEPPVEPVSPQVAEADPVVQPEPEPATPIEAPGVGPAVVKQDEPKPVTEPVKPVEVAVQPQVKPEVKPVEVVLATPPKPVTEPVLVPPVKPFPVTPVAPQPTAPAKVGAKTGADIEMPVPVYSSFSQRAGEEGVLILEIEILASGKIGFIRILESPGYERLEKSAITAVRRSKVQPALVDGEPVREVIVRSIRFRRR